MESDEKSCLTRLGNINEFDESIRKLTLEDVMTFKEKSYILSCALMFLEEFKKDNRLKTFLEFGYSIILKYSIQYKDYQPLYDFSINFGFYPISKFIKQHRLIDDYNIMNEINDINIQKYLHNNYIETFEQNRTQKNILNSDSSEISFIAPTSSGKSALIIEHIKRNFESGIKIGIIVPTKSLLMQTYKIIKESKINCKIIIHDEMYNDELEFIGVLTQERALRLIERYNIYFDTLYIDEAHNLFNYDSRNILLARLLRKNKNKNSNQKVMYLSPLIFDSNNLKFDNSEIIDEQRIDFNIKEPEYYEYKMNKEIYKFNRFIGKFYKYGKSNDIYGYINNNSQKNFIYLYSPRKIEMFSKKLYNNLNIIENNIQINEMINMLNKYVHKDFYINTLLSKGIVYLHGKLPDYIKEYLEYKFKNILELKYLVANSVILEGMNLPIDNLFILNTYNLNEKELTNLIGRVNRLNIVFSGDETSLSKLQPTIHFVNSEQWNKKTVVWNQK